jgi:nucleotide-binding universal stress UspA family protein
MTARFRNVLVLLDERPESRDALEAAAGLARRDGARVLALDVLAPLPPLGPGPDAGASALELGALVLRERERALAEAVAPLQEEGLDVRHDVTFGTPFLELVREALRGRHDLVLKAAAGQGRWSLALFGSTAMHLFRKCPAPVWVLGPGQRTLAPRRVVAAIDTTSGDDGRSKLAAKILSTALEIANDAGAELHVVQAWDVPSESILRAALRRERLAEVQDAAEKEATRSLHALLGGFGAALHRARVHLLPGPAAEVVPAFAADREADLLVLGSVGRTGVPGLLIGSTAERILSRVRCSVLALKPDGFETPVRLAPA